MPLFEVWNAIKIYYDLIFYEFNSTNRLRFVYLATVYHNDYLVVNDFFSLQ